MTPAATPSFGGGVGRLLRELDWSRHPLGPPESWPCSLRGYVDMVLEMPSPAILFWGPDRIQLYNDGYAAIMGPRHPRYLAAPYRECWPDTYPVIDPWMRGVIAEGSTVRVVDELFTLTRHGFTEEAYFTFTFSPLRDDRGETAGIFQPVVEVTAAVVGERRARTLSLLAARTESQEDALAAFGRVVDANRADLPFALLYLADVTGELSLAAACGVDPGAPAVDSLLAVAHEVFGDHRSREVEDVETGFLASAGAAWPEPVRSAVALPTGQGPGGRPRGVVILGVSPRLRFDDRYREFFERVSRQLGASLAAAEARGVQAHLLAREQSARRDAEHLRGVAEKASRAKDEFFAVLGHELRNPLAPIFTALELMRMKDHGELEREREIIGRQAHHLERLVDDLLDASRIARGKVELRRERIELSEVVRRAVEMTLPLVEQREHHLEVSVDTGGLLVDVDVVRLAQVLANLLSNAAKYTERGGRISLTAERAGDAVVVRVRDSGVGISPDVLPHVFEAFVQERQALDRAAGGLGLGLAIVKGIVELHGGSVAAHSDGAHRGSELSVRLPLAASQEASSEVKQAEVTLVAVALPRRTILVVDDNRDAADLLAVQLAGSGHRVEVAYDGPQALRLVAEIRPDLALLDIGLPVMDGFELARQLRELPGFAGLPLVALTGYGAAEDRARSRSAGFVAHLTKPVTGDRLAALVCELTRGRDSESAPIPQG